MQSSSQRAMLGPMGRNTTSPPGDSIAQELLHEGQVAAGGRPIVPIAVDRAGDEQHTTTAMPQVAPACFGVLDEQRAPLDDGRVPDRQLLLRRLYAGFVRSRY